MQRFTTALALAVIVGGATFAGSTVLFRHHYRNSLAAAETTIAKLENDNRRQTEERSQLTRKTLERMKSYSDRVDFERAQVVNAITPVPPCSSSVGPMLNSDFAPAIDYSWEGAKSTHTLKDASKTLVAVVDLAGSVKTDIRFESHDGALDISGPADLTHPEFHDLALIIKSGDKVCKLRSRLYFLPTVANVTGRKYRILSTMGRRGFGLGTFTLPYGTDFRNDNGDLLVSDCINGLIQEFNLKGELVNVIGSIGNLNGKLNRPAGVDYFGGDIYVAEENNHRFQVFDPSGRFLELQGAYSGKLNSERDKPGYFNAPIGITVERSGTIIVVDYGNDRLQGLLRNGTVKFVTGNEPGDPFEFKGPYSATVDPLNGDILVTNRGANEIAVLDKDGKKLTAFGSSILNYPHELEFGPKHALYVADLYHHRLAIFHDRSDKNVSYINFPASWGYPKTVSVDKEGRIAVGFAGSTEAFVAVIATDPSLALPSEVPPPNSRVMSMMASIGFGTPRPKTRTTEELYSRYCSNCHETGNFGAPKRRSDDWDKFSHDIGTLLPLARSGIGAMIPSGGCADCSDQELKDLIAFMLPDWKSN